MKSAIIFCIFCIFSNSIHAQYGPIKKPHKTFTTTAFPNVGSQNPTINQNPNILGSDYPGPQPNPSVSLGIPDSNSIQPNPGNQFSNNPFIGSPNPTPQTSQNIPTIIKPDLPNNNGIQQPSGDGPFWWQQNNPFEGSSAPKGVVHIQDQPKQPGASYYNLSGQQNSVTPSPRPQGVYNGQTPSPGNIYATSSPYTGPLNTTPYPGCAAALKCVDETFCTVEGIMSEQPVHLTREQYENRVPLSICQDLNTGTIGKCCRDPNYKDPWPGGMDAHHHHHEGDDHPDPCGGQGICIPNYLCQNQKQGSPSQSCRVPSDGASGICCSSALQQQPSNPIHQQTINPNSPSQNDLSKPFLNPNNNKSPVIPPLNHSSNKPLFPAPNHQNPQQSLPNPSVGQNVPSYKPSFPSINQQTPQQSLPNPSVGQNVPSYNPSLPNQQNPQQSLPNPSVGQNVPSFPSINQQTPQQSLPNPSVGQNVPSYNPSLPNQQNPQQSLPNPSVGQNTPSFNPSLSIINQQNPQQPAILNPTPSPGYNIPKKTSKPISNINSNFPSQSTNLPTQNVPSTFENTLLENKDKEIKGGHFPSPSSSTFNIPSSNYPGTPSQQNTVVSPNPVPSYVNPSNPPIQSTPSVGPSYPQQPPTIFTQSPQQVHQTSNFNQLPQQPRPFQTSPPSQYPQPQIQPGASCGVRRLGTPSPIQSQTSFGEFPWHVLILSVTNNSALCSGALIQNNAVLAPAQCLNGLTPDQVIVKAGLWQIDGNGQQKQPQVSQVTACAKHPSFDPTSLFNDLAVLILSKPFTLDYHIDTLCLPQSTGTQSRQNCIATGWGKPAFQGYTQNQPQILNQVEIRLMNGENCQEHLRHTLLGKYFKLNPSFECALPISDGQDLCQVDMGSPIACQKSDGNYELAGLYSWDLGCKKKNDPTVISRPDIEWIKTTLSKSPQQISSEAKQEELRKQLAGQSEFDTESKPGFSQGYGR